MLFRGENMNNLILCKNSIIKIPACNVFDLLKFLLQLSAFRTLKIVNEEENAEGEECLLLFNYRPPLPLGNRELRECGPV